MPISEFSDTAYTLLVAAAAAGFALSAVAIVLRLVFRGTR